MRGNIGSIDICDVTRNLVVIRKIRTLCSLCIIVPFTGEYALASSSFEPPADSADAGKQIYKCEVRVATATRMYLPFEAVLL